MYQKDFKKKRFLRILHDTRHSSNPQPSLAHPCVLLIQFVWGLLFFLDCHKPDTRGNVCWITPWCGIHCQINRNDFFSTARLFSQHVQFFTIIKQANHSQYIYIVFLLRKNTILGSDVWKCCWRSMTLHCPWPSVGETSASSQANRRMDRDSVTGLFYGGCGSLILIVVYMVWLTATLLHVNEN